MSILTTREAEQWRAALGESGAFDFYHLPAYHRIAEERGEGSARLFVYREEGRAVALPLLLRPLEGIDGLADWQGHLPGLRDATSVYGYAGPVCHPAGDDGYSQRFRTELRAWLAQEHVVTLFHRLHPLLRQRPLLQGLGEILSAGQTVAIDLTLPEAEQVARYRKSHRYEIQRAMRAGVSCEMDAAGRHLHRFAALYRETMARVGARPYYLFDDAYFERLMATPSLGFRLFVALLEGEVVAGALFSRCGALAQYHLAGTAGHAARLAPMKLIVDTARRWACAEGATTLHLGGGVGSARDSLFEFKAGFGGIIQSFQLWRWTVDERICGELNLARRSWLERNGLPAPAAGFFPPYRAPAAGL